MQFEADLQSKLISVFQAELEDRLNTLDHGLLALEKEMPSEDRKVLLNELFRAAHSLKGAARAVNFSGIGQLAHVIENALSGIQKGGRQVTPELIDTILKSADSIRASMSAYLNGSPFSDEKFAALCAELESQINPPVSGPSAAASQTVGPAADVQAPDPIVASPQPVAAPETNPARQTQQTDPVTVSIGNNALQSPISDESSASKTEQPLPAAAMVTPGPEETIRVSTSKLDTIMEGLGELLVARMRIDELVEQIQSSRQRVNHWQKAWRKARPYSYRLQRKLARSPDPEIGPLVEFLNYNETNLKSLEAELTALTTLVTNTRNHISVVTDDLEAGIRSARMIPIDSLLNIFPRMVRDLARSQGKEIDLKIEGAETEVDRQVIELLKDPLTHLLRNAVDHGIERPEQRVQAGKPPCGLIRLRAEQRGSNLVMSVSDDGSGIDIQAVRRSAVREGLITPADEAALDESAATELIFRPGLSTSEHLSEISGRGIGMDIVRKNVEQLHGLIQTRSRPGEGVTFTLTLPLTLATSQILLVRAGDQTLGLPMLNVERILRVSVDDIGIVNAKPAISMDGRLLPLVGLAQLLKIDPEPKLLTPGAKIPVIVLMSAGRRIALYVDALLSTHQVVMKDLGRQIRHLHNVSGATILGNGELIILLNPIDLIKSVQTTPTAPLILPAVCEEKRRYRVLVADDSITTRSLEKYILENAGYTVLPAADGLEAWEMIRNPNNELPDLVISDVNMPNMDGFQLTETIKKDPRTSRLPVMLITSLEKQQDKLRGMEAGANAYIVKRSFDQHELLEMAKQLIG
jgi:two-component system chemotaxis sensor kinase CheA